MISKVPSITVDAIPCLQVCSSSGALLKALPALCCSSCPLLLPATGCTLHFPFYCLWLCHHGRCRIFVLHLITLWRPLDIISHCIGGGLAEMMGDISCLSQWDGPCRGCAFFSHGVMLLFGNVHRQLGHGKKAQPLKHNHFYLWQEAMEQAELLVFPGWTELRAGG